MSRWQTYLAPVLGAIFIGAWVGLQFAHRMGPPPTPQPFRGQSSLPRVYEIGNWPHLRLTAKEREEFLSILETLPASMEPVLRSLGPRLVVDTDTRSCGGAGGGCTQTHAVYTAGKRVPDVKIFAIHLPPDIFDNTSSGSYLVLHELGHAIDQMGLSDQDILMLLRSRPGWQKAWPQVKNQEYKDGYKLNINEMWAEQWAMWATEDKSYSVYMAPRLGQTDNLWGQKIKKSFQPTFPATKFSTQR